MHFENWEVAVCGGVCRLADGMVLILWLYFHMAVDKLLILEVSRKTGSKNFEVNMKWYFFKPLYFDSMKYFSTKQDIQQEKKYWSTICMACSVSDL